MIGASAKFILQLTNSTLTTDTVTVTTGHYHTAISKPPYLLTWQHHQDKGYLFNQMIDAAKNRVACQQFSFFDSNQETPLINNLLTIKNQDKAYVVALNRLPIGAWVILPFLTEIKSRG